MDQQAYIQLQRAAERAPRSIVEAAAEVIAADLGGARAPFLARAFYALKQLLAEVDEEALADAAGAPTDLQALVRALEHPAVAGLLAARDPLAPARLRGLLARQQLLEAEGGTISAAEAAALLHLTRQAVDKRRKARTLLALPIGRHGYAYPLWQFGEEGTLPGLEQVLQALGDAGPWMRVAFFLNGNARLDGQRPLDLLRQGRNADVVRAAEAFGEHGAA